MVLTVVVVCGTDDVTGRVAVIGKVVEAAVEADAEVVGRVVPAAVVVCGISDTLVTRCDTVVADVGAASDCDTLCDFSVCTPSLPRDAKP